MPASGRFLNHEEQVRSTPVVRVYGVIKVMIVAAILVDEIQRAIDPPTVGSCAISRTRPAMGNTGVVIRPIRIQAEI